MANPELEQYIKDNLSKGVLREEILKVLLDVGWTKEDIEEAFSKFGPQHQPSPPETSHETRREESMGSKFPNKKTTPFIVIALFLVGGISVAGFYFYTKKAEKISPEQGQGIQEIEDVEETPIVLEFWNVFEDREVYSDLIQKFEKENPSVTINYRIINHTEYREKLIRGLGQGDAPDIFALHNTWLPIFREHIVPAPKDLFAVENFLEIYPEVVAFDFIRKEENSEVNDELTIYAVPLAIETLGLFYNKDHFANAGLNRAPVTWEDILDYTRLLTQYNDSGHISLSGIVLGSAGNINRSIDILSLLMM